MNKIRLSPSGRTVAVEPGDTVLGALEREGYALANNCRAGACGECKTKVLSGDFDQGVVLSMALSDQDRADGYGLMCMATPLSDELEIEFGTADALPKLFAPHTAMPFVVTDRIERTQRIVELRLRPVDKAMRYWPGQYILLGDAAAGVTPRCYSIANAPRPDGEITLLVSRVPDGHTSSWVHAELTPGTQVSVDGPYGTFVGDPATDTPVLCLAAGSGLAPILALTDAALRRGFPHPVTLVFSARTDDAVLEAGLFAWWQAVHPNFKAVTTLTGGGDEQGGHNLRVPDLLPVLFDSLADTTCFVAGSPEFVEACAAVVAALGADPDRVHSEGFVNQAGPVTPPADRLAHH